MKGNENCSPHGWTVDTLETYLTAKIDAIARLVVEHEDKNKERFEAARQAVNASLLASEKAVSRAEASNDHRLAAVNEFRAQLGDQEKTLLPRPEYQVQHQALTNRIDKAEASIVELLTRVSVSKATPLMITSLIGTAISVLMFSGLFLMFFLHTKGGMQ